jgi:hypothetical protein
MWLPFGQFKVAGSGVEEWSGGDDGGKSVTGPGTSPEQLDQTIEPFDTAVAGGGGSQ